MSTFYKYTFLSFLLLCCCKTTKKFAPLGTVKLSDSLYIDKEPVTNLDYIEFLSNIEVYWSPETSDSLQNLKPYGLTGRNFAYSGGRWGLSSNSGTDYKGENEPYDISASPFYGNPDSTFFYSMVNGNFQVYGGLDLYTYLTHPVYRDYPTVFITREQAEAYCKWRSDLVKIHYAVTIEDSASYAENYIPIKKYRLPTTEEWSMAYQKLGFDFKNNEELQKLAEVHDQGIDGERLYSTRHFKINYGDTPFHVLPNNVSEVVADGHIGYGWDDDHQDFSNRIDSVRIRIGTGPSTSFRCICEVEVKQ